MDALVKAIEARGFKITVSEKTATSVELLGETVAISLEEKAKREDHVLTKEESERKAKFSWSSAPRWDYHPSGILQLQINESWGRGVRKTWSDGRKYRLEEVLNNVVAGIVVVAEAKRQEQIELERQRREWAEAERQRLELEQSRREEAERLKALEQEVALWTRSQGIRAYVDAVEREVVKSGMAIESGSKLHGWLAWARKSADRLDPLTTDTDQGR
jgi:hypothetical protein